MGAVEADFALLRRKERDFNDEPDDDEPDVDKDELDDVELDDDDEPDVDEDELDNTELDDERHNNELQPEPISFFRACCLARRDVTTVHPSPTSCG